MTRRVFCTACGASNPEDARFCNQCGVTLVAEGDGKPSTLTGVGGSRGTVSAQGRGPSAQGGGSLDGVALPMNGLPRGRVMAIAAGTGALCLALGAAIAYRAPEPSPHVVPVTPVGLLGEPAAVVPVEPSGRPAATPRRNNSGARSPAAPRGPGGVAPGGPAPGGQQPSSGDDTNTGNGPAANTGNGPAANAGNGTEANTGNGPAANTGNGPAANAGNGTAANAGNGTASNTGGSAPTAPAENGVIERGPRVSSGGYHLGDDTDATGTMDPRVFSFVYNQKRAQISACYSSASRSRPVSGIIVLRVRINTQGRVASTRVISDSVRVPELAQCVQTAVRGWAYPQPEGGDVEVDYPMRFGSSS